MTDPHKQVWNTAYVDYSGPFPSGEYPFVAVDETSKYPKVHITRSSSAATAITHLSQMFATHGIPEVITSHNVPLGLKEFNAWCKQSEIKHRKIIPLWPAANAQVERFDKTLEKTMRIVSVQGKSWPSEPFVFLMNSMRTDHDLMCGCCRYLIAVTVGCLKCVQFHNWFRLHQILYFLAHLSSWKLHAPMII